MLRCWRQFVNQFCRVEMFINIVTEFQVMTLWQPGIYDVNDKYFGIFWEIFRLLSRWVKWVVYWLIGRCETLASDWSRSSGHYWSLIGPMTLGPLWLIFSEQDRSSKMTNRRHKSEHVTSWTKYIFCLRIEHFLTCGHTFTLYWFDLNAYY